MQSRDTILWALLKTREVTPMTPIPTQSVSSQGGLWDLVIFPLLKSKRENPWNKNIWFCVLCFSKLSIRLSVLVRRPCHVWGMPHHWAESTATSVHLDASLTPLMLFSRTRFSSAGQMGPSAGRNATVNLEGQSIRGEAREKWDWPSRTTGHAWEHKRALYLGNLQRGTPSCSLVPVTFVSEKN